MDKTKQVMDKIDELTRGKNWGIYNSTKTQEKIIALNLLEELLDCIKGEDDDGRYNYTLKEKILCMFIYGYSQFSARRAMSDIELIRIRCKIHKIPHFNSILNMFSELKMTRILLDLIEITSMPLRMFEDHLTIDSSGFSTSEFMRWFDVRTNRNRKLRCWRKAHLICGARTNIIASLTITEGHEHDSPQLIPLVHKAEKNFDIKEISADKAYSSRANLKAIAKIGAIPYIPFKKNTTGKPKGCRLWNALFEYFNNNYDEFMKHYHLRSNAESTFSMIKRNFGKKLRTKRPKSQMNEILVKCLCHNLSVLVQKMFEFGFDPNIKDCAKKHSAQE